MKRENGFPAARGFGLLVFTAWKEKKSVLFLCPALAFLGLGMGLIRCLALPALLEKIVERAPAQSLLGSAAVFAAALTGLAALREYLRQNAIYGRIQVRSSLVWKVQQKRAVTSFPNIENPKVRSLENAADLALNGNSAAAEAVWETASNLLEHGAGFLVYSFLLFRMGIPAFLLLSAAAAAGACAAGRQGEKWEAFCREEETKAAGQMLSACQKAEDPALAADARMFDMDGWLWELYGDARSRYQKCQAEKQKGKFLADALCVLLETIRMALTCAYLAALVWSGRMTPWDFLLGVFAAKACARCAEGFLEDLFVWRGQGRELEKVREDLEREEPFHFDDGLPLDAEQTGGALFADNTETWELKLENVSFRYPGASGYALRHINLTIRPGERLAVTGKNGAGKSTLIKLICGFYDPTEGAVLLNGQDIRRYNRADYYRLFSAVFQQTSLLAVTVRENITQTAGEYDRARMEECARRAGIAGKIERLPEGYETHVTTTVYPDGTDFSGGELQKLLLARALYKDAPILVLDEPAAALDPLAEQDLYKRYRKMTEGKTGIFLSHRLAFSGFCSRIGFLENGRIVQEGAHEELMKEKGGYAELFETQSRYYRKGGADEGI